MNPFAAVEPISAARGPLATLQALADALAGPALPPPKGEPGMDMREPANGLNTGPTGSINVPTIGPTHEPAHTQAPGAMPPSGATPTAVTTAQALQGRITLGQLAAEPTALRSTADMPVGAVGAEASRSLPIGTPAPEAGNTLRPSDTLAVPVLLTPPFATAGHAARAREAPQAPAARRRAAEWPQRRPGSQTDADADAAPEPDEDGSAAPERRDASAATDLDPADDSAASHDPEAGALRALLLRAGQVEALRELALGRRVLVVLPQAGGGRGAAPAAAALLTSGQVQRFGARWWPGTAHAVRPGWLRWRVFRSGDPQLETGLRSRCAGTACHLRLGAHGPRLTDAGTAQVELAERIRFTQALGAQWSLLVVAAPLGAFE